jgi:hypothetical protein
MKSFFAFLVIFATFLSVATATIELESYENSVDWIPPDAETISDALQVTFGSMGSATSLIRERLRQILLSPSNLDGAGSGDEKLLKMADLLFLDDASAKQVPRLDAFLEKDGSLQCSSENSLERYAHDAILAEPTMTPTANIQSSATISAPTIALLRNQTSGVNKKGVLSTKCVNQMCDYLQYELSCKAQNLGMKRVWFSFDVCCYCPLMFLDDRFAPNISWVFSTHAQYFHPLLTSTVLLLFV